MRQEEKDTCHEIICSLFSPAGKKKTGIKGFLINFYNDFELLKYDWFRVIIGRAAELQFQKNTSRRKRMGSGDTTRIILKF
jgi:hypothetical protein